MYPQVTQFETRERLLQDELQLLRQRHSLPARRERPMSRRRALYAVIARAFAERTQRATG